MDLRIKEILCKTVPKPLYKDVERIYQSCRVEEEKKHSIGNNSQRGPRCSFMERPCCSSFSSEARQATEDTVTPVVIAKVMMQLWSPKMYRYVEDLILTNAIKEKYFLEEQRQWVHILDGDIQSDENKTGWLVSDQDQLVFDLVWNIFNLKKHFDEVRSHRLWIQRSYDRLQKFMPELSPDIIQRHDLTKYAFSQAIGYTLKWIHNVSNPIWRAACDLHLFCEPHHVELWSSRHTPEEKYKKLQTWFGRGSTPANLDDIDWRGQSLPYPFFLESFVDMVAVEWERKKGQRLNITDSELVSMDDKFLGRYTRKQYGTVKTLMRTIESAEKREHKIDMEWD